MCFLFLQDESNYVKPMGCRCLSCEKNQWEAVCKAEGYLNFFLTILVPVMNHLGYLCVPVNHPVVCHFGICSAVVVLLRMQSCYSDYLNMRMQSWYSSLSYFCVWMTTRAMGAYDPIILQQLNALLSFGIGEMKCCIVKSNFIHCFIPLKPMWCFGNRIVKLSIETHLKAFPNRN